jgi:hypothetical protein
LAIVEADLGPNEVGLGGLYLGLDGLALGVKISKMDLSLEVDSS